MFYEIQVREFEGIGDTEGRDVYKQVVKSLDLVALIVFLNKLNLAPTGEE